MVEVHNLDAVFMLEAGEFMADFECTIRRIGKALVPGGTLIMTRPAWPVSLLFPFRSQDKSAMRDLLTSAGFERTEIVRWCWRYDLVQSKRSAEAGQMS